MIPEFCKKMFGKSLWLFHTNCGSCNGCDIEVIDVLTPYYDVERFGMKLVASPRHADALIVAGPVSRQVAPALKRLYEATPEPKVVIAVGACAVGGNIWFDTYNVLGGTDRIIPVTMYVPGCPPRPEAIIYGAALALGLVPKKVEPQQEKHLPPGFNLGDYLVRFGSGQPAAKAQADRVGR